MSTTQNPPAAPTPDEAREILSRFNASHFNRTDHEHARYRIPADPAHDDDLRLSAFIEHDRGLRAQVEKLREALTYYGGLGEVYIYPDNWNCAKGGGHPPIDAYQKVDMSPLQELLAASPASCAAGVAKETAELRAENERLIAENVAANGKLDMQMKWSAVAHETISQTASLALHLHGLLDNITKLRTQPAVEAQPK